MSGDDGLAGAVLPPAIGRYRVVSRLATGLTGPVYEAFDPRLERRVAVKVFDLQRLDARTADAMAAAFAEDVRRAGSLAHPGIVPVFDAGTVPGALFVAREFVDGDSLDRVAGDDALRDLTARVALFRQVAEAVAFAGARGIAHGRLRPASVLVGTDGQARVIGFGTASMADVLAAPSEAAARYRAPERRDGVPGDPRADVFSLAVMLGDVVRIPGHPIQSEADACPDELGARGVTPSAWAGFLARALAPDPDRRFPSAGALLEAFLSLGAFGVSAAQPVWNALWWLDVGAAPADEGGDETETTAAPRPRPGVAGDVAARSASEPDRRGRRPDDPPMTVTKV